jgi:hypothetical protein
LIGEGPLQWTAGQQNGVAGVARDMEADRVRVLRRKQRTGEEVGPLLDLREERHHQEQERYRIWGRRRRI